METKNCFNCGDDKPLDEFPIKKSTKDGLHSRCRECLIEYNKEYRKNKKATKRDLTPEQKEKMRLYKREYNKKYNQENKEKIEEREKEYRKKNPNKDAFRSIEKALGKKGRSWKMG